MGQAFHVAFFCATLVLVVWAFLHRRRQSGDKLSNALVFLALALCVGQAGVLLRDRWVGLSRAALGLEFAFLGLTFFFLGSIRRKRES